MTNRLFILLTLLSVVFIGCPAPDEDGDKHGFQGTVFFTNADQIRKIDLSTGEILTLGKGHSPLVTSTNEVLASLHGVGLVKYSSSGAIRTTLVPGTNDITDPQLSSIEQTIAFASTGNVYIVDALTGEPIDSVEDAIRPQWLSDTKLLFQRNDELLSFDMRTRSINLIAQIGAFRDPAISPDRSRIAFVDGKDLFTISVDGSSVKAIMSGHTELRYPAWSRDGQYIVVKDGCDFKLFKVSGGMAQSFRGHFFSFTDAQCPDASQLDWQ